MEPCEITLNGIFEFRTSPINVSRHSVCCFCYRSKKPNSGLRDAPHQKARQTRLVKKLNRQKFQKNAFWMKLMIPFWTLVQAETPKVLLKEQG